MYKCGVTREMSEKADQNTKVKRKIMEKLKLKIKM